MSGKETKGGLKQLSPIDVYMLLPKTNCKECGEENCMAFATKVVDRVGAGDAVLAMTTMLVKLNAPWEIVGFLGNIAGAQLVSQLGNKVSLNKTATIKHVTSLLK